MLGPAGKCRESVFFASLHDAGHCLVVIDVESDILISDSPVEKVIVI